MQPEQMRQSRGINANGCHAARQVPQARALSRRSAQFRERRAQTGAFVLDKNYDRRRIVAHTGCCWPCAAESGVRTTAIDLP
jgi:hypothetical protein